MSEWKRFKDAQPEIGQEVRIKFGPSANPRRAKFGKDRYGPRWETVNGYLPAEHLDLWQPVEVKS